MINASDFRNGVTFEMDNGVWTIVSFLHVKPGKGAAFVRTKIKNVVTGSVIERTFNPTEKFPKAYIETKEMQYTYNDGDFYHFMDLETYDDLPLTHDQVEDAMPFVKENTNVTVRFFKGDPAANTTKPATFETGLTLQVPLFIETGEVLKIDTRDGGMYLGRA